MGATVDRPAPTYTLDAVYDMEVQELQRIEALKEETTSMAQGAHVVGMFSNILAVKVRIERPSEWHAWQT